ncbi:MAG: helix-turn-helix transcriptional regulator [Clostridia bacterium]|nr:helix-turn-helix transcriptional regulator [Clostridia bacterium]
MKDWLLALLRQFAAGIASEFGQNCEVVVHDIGGAKREHSIVVIENGHVSARALGDGPSRVVLEAMRTDPDKLNDKLCYLTQTEDGRILRSTTIFVRDESGKNIEAVFSVNYDITSLVLAEGVLKEMTAAPDANNQPQRIVQNVNDLLDELLQQSVELTGKPVALMTKEDKVRALQFLNDAGAFLITKSSDKVCKFFGITKYALYHSIDVRGQKE